MNGCLSYEDEPNCTCTCHTLKNNVACMNCKCKPVYGDVYEKVLFLERAFDNVLKRMGNVQADIKSVMIKIKELEDRVYPSNNKCPMCGGKGAIGGFKL